MFTDLVGYTALGQRSESLALSVADDQRRLLRPIFKRYAGREVKTMGDAFLVEFSSALNAVKCACEIQKAAREFNSSLDEERSVHLRVGVHLGDILESEGDISGDSVNVASRIESLADDGGVCITRQVYDQVQNKFELPLESLGVRMLKNVKTPLEVYKIVMPWTETKTSPSGQLDKRRLAILPFANISASSADEYFADGMTGELIATMARISGLKVIARTSVMSYKGGQKKISDVARELEVGTVLEGSVRKSGDRLRITVQLIDSQTSDHMWAESYDRELKDVFAVQSDIAKTVAKALKVQLLSREKSIIEKEQTVDPEAYALYLKGRFYWNERTHEGTDKAVKHFEKAVKIDPKFALAYSGLADCYNILSDYQWMAPNIAGPLARDFATKAIEIDENLAEAHASLALTMTNYFWDFSSAERELKRAIELRPNYAPAHHWRAIMLLYQKRFGEAYEQEKRAISIDPYSRVINNLMAGLLAILGEKDEAMERYHRIFEIYPGSGSVHGWKAAVHAWLSEYDLAIEEAKRAFDLDKNPSLESTLAWVYAVAGKNDKAQGILDQMMSRVAKEYVSPVWIGLVELALNRSDEGFRWLEKGLAERDSSLLYFACLPWFEEYRQDPKWEKIEAHMGLR